MGMKIEVLAVNDTGLFHVGRVSRTSGGVYFVPKIRRSDYHLSRHVDGTTHWRSRSERRTLLRDTSSSLEQIKFEQLCSMSLNSTALPAYFDEYKRQTADGLFLIDLRRFRSDRASLFVALLSPKYFRQARGLFSKLEQVYLHTGSVPWLVLGAW
jgi:hypothetical protein